MTDEQRFFFDLQGWLLLPAVLTDSKTATMCAECCRGVDPAESRPGGVRDGYSGILNR
jgi:hypothetical protein